MRMRPAAVANDFHTADRLTSWGGCHRFNQVVEPHAWTHESIPVPNGRTYLPYGLGRSYGDSCLNDGGVLLVTTALNHLIAFDARNGLLRCEAGVSLAELLKFIVPRGWFLPTTPGTKFVTVGGAIANDVHGKNHHRVGTFGCHVREFELLRSDGERLRCSRTKNPGWFSATIGGLGLTGLITWAEFNLRPISGPTIAEESERFGNFEEFGAISEKADHEFEYTVSWLDCLAAGRSLGRGICLRGRHAERPGCDADYSPRSFGMPIGLPRSVINRHTIRAFNALLYHRHHASTTRRNVHYETFFYPLDSIHHWNRIYGRRGFFQYQCVVPFARAKDAIREILARTAAFGKGTLAVLKAFGPIKSPGLLSFPRPGLTLALDFPNNGESTLKFFEDLDKVVRAAEGRLYPAKDARMSPEMFQESYPEWREFAGYVDPAFSSSFWRRVTA